MSPLMLLREGNLPALCLMSGALGGIIGSFLGVVAERIPPLVKEEEGAGNLLFPASHCPECGHPLSWWENIPVLSWCGLRGRCRCCKAAIPVRLLLLELSSALFFALTAAFAPSLTTLIALWVLWCGLLPLATIDAKHMLLPDCLTQSLLWAGLLYHALCHTLPLTDALYGAVAGYLSLWLVYWAFRLTTGREGLGYGDFKLLAALGAWCGWQALPSLLLAAALSGIALYCLFYKAVKKNNVIPFGPMLSLAGLVIFILQTLQLTF
ncbi:TPA: prepilin peptidase [Enterobacter cloacae]|uniref:prepilin peptidase n=1 Tax=Enterobacter cloacae TaxID=550 RepID=UPI0021D07574|nr:A24 family peptidase [Enterobacter cloacae]MCU6281726.1 A24 family peptidase [Enterobacter cloacae]HEC5278614.1 prepilin peptidase [Enterobacter cloacae]